MRSRVLLVVPAFLAAASGCERTPGLDPRPSAVEPAGSDGEAPTPVVIHGSGFLARVRQDGGGSVSSASVVHRAWIDDVELPDVVWVDAGTLRATVPAGLPVGPHALTVENALGRTGRLEDAFTVVVPAALVASASVSPVVASTGQTVTVELAVTNTGGASALALVPEVALSGAGAASALPPPPPVDLHPGEQRDLVVSLVASGAGEVTIRATARGVEAFTGRKLAASASVGPILVEREAALRGRLSIPSTIHPGGAFAATLHVTNEGEAAALAVAPDALAAAPGSDAPFSVLGDPSPSIASIPGGASQTFTWPCTLDGPGSLELVTSASGTDANGGWPVGTGPLASNVARQILEVEAGPSDPYGDGLSAGMLAAFGGRLLWGPSVSGELLWSRAVGDPGDDSTFGLTLGVDLGSSRSSNAAWRANPPATTIGAAGCTPGTLACGPNDERERGVLASGIMGGVERLLLAGASAVGGQYLYLASSDADPLSFAFLDLARIVPRTIAPSAALFAPTQTGGTDRLYVGFSAPAGNQAPALLALARLPPAAGLDAVAGDADTIDLRADLMPALGHGGAAPNPAAVPRIDAIARFQGSIYVANNGGILRSTVPEPRSYSTNPADWSSAIPSSAAYASRASLESTRAFDLTPADRAFPAFAAFGACGDGSCLFAARNVVGTSPSIAPQLWLCEPQLQEDPLRCDPGDWSLAAPNQAGDASLTQLEDPANGAISVLAATERYLYVGFDNATTGVQLYRADRVPSAPGDFRGRDGCPAGSPGCEGLGGNGFGDTAAHPRFLDALVISTEGGTSLFVLAGNGVGPSRLFELSE